MNGKQWAWTIFFGVLITAEMYGIAHNRHGAGFTVAGLLLIVGQILQWEYWCRRVVRS